MSNIVEYWYSMRIGHMTVTGRITAPEGTAEDDLKTTVALLNDHDTYEVDSFQCGLVGGHSMAKVIQEVVQVPHDDIHAEGHCVMYTEHEGARLEVLHCATEDQANSYMDEYEKTGFITLPKYMLYRGGELMNEPTQIKPLVAIQTKNVRTLRSVPAVIELPSEGK